ncbi:unnamed protein product [Acanthoscelides obtectus]|uniref:Uncharacterized protein n=1 Tax=Acanthoscelides obtectus TaxID=200917 RepID=A0A9P0KYA5_ACAOB|nr:unnamed protein product [Acanthoscelides obtectus]CAK1630581.1 hypothetical protein AOBTE_LOCUS6422 [Acanthoscelides obtectus]
MVPSNGSDAMMESTDLFTIGSDNNLGTDLKMDPSWLVAETGV